MGLRREDADHRHRQLFLQPRQRSRGGGVARDEDELHVLLLEIGADLAREAPDLLERTRAVRQARVVAEVDEVLVRHGHEALVQNGETTDSGVEDADGTRIHGEHRKGGGSVRLWVGLASSSPLRSPCSSAADPRPPPAPRRKS